MVVSIKDGAKLAGIGIIACCATLVCALFFNFYLDIQEISGEITGEMAQIYYQAQVSTAQVVCLVTGGCLLLTSVVTLLFYIKNYIDTHKKELGILKALGYSNGKIASGFWVFGSSTLLGTLAGLAGAFALMPAVYKTQNKEHTLPETVIHFHPSVLLYFVVLPTVGFGVLAIFYAWIRLKMPVLHLLKDNTSEKSATPKRKAPAPADRSFLSQLRRVTLTAKKTLVFFMGFSAFCFSAMTQMAFSMKDLSSALMGAMTLIIGLVLAFTTLFLAVTTVVRGNAKTIAMMQVLGYSQKECAGAILGCYRPASYVGFALGTVYQYGLLRLMVDIVFRDVAGVPAYRFDWAMMGLSLAVFLVVYELMMYFYARKLHNVPLRIIMTE